MIYHLVTYLFDTVDSLSFLRLFQYLSFRAICAALTGFGVTLLFGQRIIRLLYVNHVRDNPRTHGEVSTASKAGTPLMGGLLIIASIFASILLWSDLLNRFTMVFLLALVWFSLFGFIDDYRKVRYRDSDRGLSQAAKLFFQAVFGFGFGLIFLLPDLSPVSAEISSELYLPFVKDPVLDLGWWYLPFIAFVIVAIANAVNFADGLDGLSIVPVSFTVVVYGVFAYVIGNAIYSGYLQFTYLPGSGELTVICAGVFGACMGFLWYNAYPAQVFMGDVGALPLGGIVGTLAVLLKQEFLFVITGGIFVAMAFSVLVQEKIGIRWLGRRIFYMAPLHHAFQYRGLAETKVVIRIWIIAGILAIIGLSTLKIR